MNPEEISTTVTAATRAIEDRYVFPERGVRVAAALRAHLQSGRYAACAGPEELAALVTADLHEAADDLHLRLLFHDEGAAGEEDQAVLEAFWADHDRRTAGGMRRIERLADNIALVEIGPVIGHPTTAGASIVAAMSLVADADALVLDARGCRGGSPDGVVLVLSHLFGSEPVRLSDIESREEGTRQFWTAAVVPGRRFGPDKPVVVLVGPETFSGGEGLAFDLQEQGRATIVGQPTRGGAHPRIGLVVHPQLELTLPIARSVSLTTGGNWECVGVQPDVVVPAGDALDAALDLLRH
ncbi:N-terminal domain of Peptidase_S41 [Pedococcus dokdonensis]|uniref:N-terminal domain of Peptidase_S41 n=1 Tax=Pedococcus dokdonensis TaxID=443156 RepID=A0A1H0Q4T7_9MICO|nr:S41 family peptidase [Pedococcus dokdonensis]SDP12383.1 N-terminal domain of Peptidase_S41 [Pedococcus dokdonensis]